MNVGGGCVPVIGGSEQDLMAVHMKMMNAATEPTESSQQLSEPYILQPSASNYKSKFSQVHMIHYNLSTIIYQSGFQMLLTLRRP